MTEQQDRWREAKKLGQLEEWVNKSGSLEIIDLRQAEIFAEMKNADHPDAVIELWNELRWLVNLVKVAKRVPNMAKRARQKVDGA